MLIVKADQQIALLDVEALKAGTGQPIRGYINDVRFTNRGGPQTGAIPVSRDGKYLFVSQHSLAWISIIDLQKVEAGCFRCGRYSRGLRDGGVSFGNCCLRRQQTSVPYHYRSSGFGRCYRRGAATYDSRSAIGSRRGAGERAVRSRH